MGRRLASGTLSLDSQPSPRSAAPSGQKSGAAAVLVSAAIASGSWHRNDAQGVLLLAKADGHFCEGETLVQGQRALGMALSE